MQKALRFEVQPAVRNERLIAVGRALLAVSALFAIWLDPISDNWNVGSAGMLLPAYAAYTVLILPVVWRADPFIQMVGIVSHAIDLIAYSVLIFLTEGTVSPFYLYFAFAIACAALRWDWRGIALTCVTAIAVHLTIGIYTEWMLGKAEFDLGFFIIRNSHLAVLSLLFAWIGLHQQRRRQQLMRLANGYGRAGAPTDVPGIVREAARLGGVPVAILVWQEPDEPWTYCIVFDRGAIRSSKMAPDFLAALVHPEVAQADFLCPAPDGKRSIMRRSDELEICAESPLSPDFTARFPAHSVLSLELSSDTIQGRLFLLDRPGLTSDDMTLGHIIAQQALSRLEHLYWDRQARETAAVEERLRLGRNLHDGVLQSLAGAALQMNDAIGRLQKQGADTAPIESVQTILLEEQRALRRFINQAGSFADAFGDLPGIVADLRESTRRDWDMAVTVDGELPTMRPNRHLAMELHALLREAANNAARHAKARQLIIRGTVRDDILELSIENDGQGFPFRGQYSLEEMRRRGVGPKSVIARVLSLRGDVQLQTGPSGSRLTLNIPLRQTTDADGRPTEPRLAQQDRLL